MYLGSIFHSEKKYLIPAAGKDRIPKNTSFTLCRPLGYSLQTGFAGLLSGNMAFYVGYIYPIQRFQVSPTKFHLFSI